MRLADQEIEYRSSVETIQFLYAHPEAGNYRNLLRFLGKQVRLPHENGYPFVPVPPLYPEYFEKPHLCFS